MGLMDASCGLQYHHCSNMNSELSTAGKLRSATKPVLAALMHIETAPAEGSMQSFWDAM